jgi:hypothetical protein
MLQAPAGWAVQAIALHRLCELSMVQSFSAGCMQWEMYQAQMASSTS